MIFAAKPIVAIKVKTSRDDCIIAWLSALVITPRYWMIHYSVYCLFWRLRHWFL